MITLDNYAKILGGKRTIGQVHKDQSDMIMEQTWWNDIAARIGYFYDYAHDTHIKQLNDLHPTEDSYKIPMDIKFIVNSSQTYSKDDVTYHLQLRPSQQSNVIPYYKECFEDRYAADFPVGLYVDIEDSKGVWNRWLVVATANYNDPQFSTYELLRCDKIINYIFDGKKYFVPSVCRSQNSYNSGVWQDNKFVIPEDQYKFIVPLDRDTELLYYNQRMALDVDGLLTEPRVWKVSKINRIASPGTALITLAQDKYNPNADYRDENDVWWCDYYDQLGAPTVINDTEPIDNIYGVITCAGTQSIKVRGSYKKLKISYFNKDQEIEVPNGTWHFYFNNSDASSLISISTNGVSGNEIKIKFLGESEYIGKELTVRYIPVMGDAVDFILPIVSL